MNSGKTLTGLTVCLTFWLGIVVLLLFFNGGLNDGATATPIAKHVPKAVFPAEDFSIPNMPAIPVVETVEAPHTEIAGEIMRGESFDFAMKRLHIDNSARAEIIQGFGKILDFKILQPGDRFTVLFDENNSVTQATYASGIVNTYNLSRNDDGSFLASREPVLLESKLEKVAGVIESSLYNSFVALGEEPRLIHAYADIFASKIDFNTETQTGDRFELLVEKYYKGTVFVGYGHILMARYQQKNTTFEGYRYATKNTPTGYFDANGEALGTWFIRSPIPFGRVTSRFSLHRKHPIDGVVRPHLGVDLAAPRGTPVMAAADGKVEFIGRRGGFGKTVILHHNGGYKTYYGHLSGYKKGLKTGSAVSQKEIIGYVGSTGRSTGPHLDYRIQHNGVFRNPFGMKFQAKTVLQGEELARFHQESAGIARLFNTDTDTPILQVKTVTLSDDHAITFL